MNTKKLALVVLIFFTGFLFQGNAEAVFSVDLNFFSIDFGNMDSGYSGSYKDDIPSIGLTATCTTDQGSAWSLLIRNDNPLRHNNYSSFEIDNANFRWYGTNVTGVLSSTARLTQTREDFIIERTVYSGIAGEGVSGTDITMKFELTMPPLFPSGIYETNIVFTFTE